MQQLYRSSAKIANGKSQLMNPHAIKSRTPAPAMSDPPDASMEYRVCMVVLQDYLRDARVKRYAESLADNGANVDILCVRSEHTSIPDYRDDIRIYRIPLRHGATSGIGYLIEYFMAVVLFSLWLSVLYTRNRYHVVHVHNMPDFLISSALLPRLFGARLILDVHDPMPEFYASKFETSVDALPIRFLRLQERLSAGLAHRVIAANDNFRRKLIGRGVPARKLTVVNNIADTRIFNRSEHPRWAPIDAPATDRAFVLIFAGTLAPRYGLDVPIQAAVRLKESIPTLLIRIVGRQNDYTAELAQMVKNLGVEKHVELVPEVPVQDVPKLLAEADIGIYTARSDPHMDIATPTKVLEYAQMGLPVVASRLSILETYFDDNSIRFTRPSDIDDFAEAIEELWASPEARRALVDNADNGFIRNHNWRNEQKTYFEMLQNLLG